MISRNQVFVRKYILIQTNKVYLIQFILFYRFISYIYVVYEFSLTTVSFVINLASTKNKKIAKKIAKLFTFARFSRCFQKQAVLL